jgi:hypothetical protein
MEHAERSDSANYLPRHGVISEAEDRPKKAEVAFLMNLSLSRRRFPLIPVPTARENRAIPVLPQSSFYEA